MTGTPSIFTRIINGELPGRFVWQDDDVVAFLTIAPIRPGHVLVVPRAEIDRFTELPADLWSRVAAVAQIISAALEQAFDCARVGLLVVGLEVPHCHVHVVPIDSEADLNFALADPSVSPEALDEVQQRIRAALRAAGHEVHVPS